MEQPPDANVLSIWSLYIFTKSFACMCVCMQLQTIIHSEGALVCMHMHHHPCWILRQSFVLYIINCVEMWTEKYGIYTRRWRGKYNKAWVYVLRLILEVNGVENYLFCLYVLVHAYLQQVLSTIYLEKLLMESILHKFSFRWNKRKFVFPIFYMQCNF